MFIPVLSKIKLDALSKIKIDLVFKPMITIIFILQFASSSYAFYKDVNFKFTLSHDAADYLKANNMDKDHEFVGYIDYAAQTIAINLKRKIYFPQSGGSNYVWSPFDKNYKQNITMVEIFNACIRYIDHQDKKVVLILNFPLLDNKQQQLESELLTQTTSIKLLKAFTGDIIQADEQFWLYEVAKINR